MNSKSFAIRRLAPAWLLVMALLLIIGPAAQAAGGVTAALGTSGRPVTVGDPVGLVVSVRHPAGYQVVPPRLEATWGDFSVRSVAPARVTTNPDGTSTTTVEIDARLFKPGAFKTPPLNVTVTDGSGNLMQTIAAPVPVTVASVLAQGDTALRDIKGQAALPLPAAWPWVLAGSLALAMAAGALFWYIRSRRKPAEDNRLPHERALDELSAIEAMRLPQGERFKEHYTLVSDCIRTYVERAFSIPALEHTTDEIEADLSAANFATEVQAALVGFLQDSDIVKFTTLTPDEQSATSLLMHGRAIVQATMPQPAAPEREPRARPAGARRPRRPPHRQVTAERAPEAAL